MFAGVTVLAAFGAGLFSFVSPCVLPLIPVYFASLCGPGVLEASATKRIPVFLHAFSFVLGFSLVFSLWGAGAGLLGSALVGYLVQLRIISGSLLVLFGVFMLAALKVPWLNYELRMRPNSGQRTGYARSFVTGGVFCFAWTPCVGPVLGGILTLAAGSGGAGSGALLLAIYSLGLGLPFLAIGLGIGWLLPLIKSIRRYSAAVYIAGGLLMIAVGILVLANKLTWFASWRIG